MSDLPVLVALVRRAARVEKNGVFPKAALEEFEKALGTAEARKLARVLAGKAKASPKLRAKAKAVRLLALGEYGALGEKGAARAKASRDARTVSAA